MMDTLKVGHRFTLPFEQELQAHLAWLIKLRWLAASGVVATTWSAQVIFRFEVPATALYGIGLIIFLYNALYFLFYAKKVAKAPKRRVVLLNRFAQGTFSRPHNAETSSRSKSDIWSFVV